MGEFASPSTSEMITDDQVLLLFKLVVRKGLPLTAAAAKAGMCETTARKYVRLGKVPSDTEKPHTWRTRKDPFAEVWDEARAFLDVNPGLKVKALFGELQRRHPGRLQQGQLRTLQRRVKHRKAMEGTPKEGLLRPRVCPGERA